MILTFSLALPVFASVKTNVDEVAEQYVQLALALGQHDKNYIDAYYGPSEWKDAAKKNKIELKKVIIAGKLLLDVLSSEKAKEEIEQLRLAYLKAQINSMVSRALIVHGSTKYDFDQESLMLYDTQAPVKDMSEFEAILKKLDKTLPGKDSLLIKVENFRKQFVVPKEKLQVVFDAAIKACRERTKQFVQLLDNENFTLEFVTDKPWSGYNWYQGEGISLIQVNTELPIDISRAIDLGCHEGYPGHHTYNGLLEANLYKKRGWVEYSVYPLFSPQSLIAEGSANYGIEMAFPGKEKIQFEKSVLYPLAGIDPKLAEKHSAVSELTAQLNYAGNEIARLYRNGKIDASKAQEMFQKYTLMSAEKAKQRVRFVDTYGAYVINYNWGKDMVKQWVESGADKTQAGRWKRFAKLLSSPRLPSTLN